MNNEIHCSGIRSQFSEYLDGMITGVAMHQVAQHLESCPTCAEEFAGWRRTQTALAELGPLKPPADLALRLRVALSQERTKTPARSFAQWQVYWQNTMAPIVLQASAGLASTVLLLGTVGLLIGMFATPEPLAARDEPIGRASSPRFLYSTNSTNEPAMGPPTNPLVVEAMVNGDGRVYDYRILSGPVDKQTRSNLENQLLFSVFEPARVFGQPVRGLAVMSFAGVSVKG
jgi:hypothetical protein